MNQPVLSRLLHALDAAVTTSDPRACGSDLGAAGELATLRLRCLQRRLGIDQTTSSPYLELLRRTCHQGSWIYDQNAQPYATVAGLAASA